MTTLAINGTYNKGDCGRELEHSGSEGVLYELYIRNEWLIDDAIVCVPGMIDEYDNERYVRERME